MPFGIRPSNVRVCHSTTRAFERVKRAKFAAEGAVWQVSFGNLLLVLVIMIETKGKR